MKKIRFGIIGLSRIARKAIIPVLANSPFSELTMIGTRAPEKAVDIGYTLGSYDDVLKDPEIDAVYISLPNSMHEEWAVRAATAGKHVWCEKPAALTYGSAQKMVDAALAGNVRLMEGFMFRYHPQHAYVREIIASGKIGDVTGFEGRIAYPWPDDSNIRLNAGLGGGMYYDALVYPIRASRMLLDAEPEALTCELTMDPRTGIDHKDAMVLRYPGERTATISAEFTEDYRSTYRIIGTRGSVHMERAYAVPRDLSVRVYVESDGKSEEKAMPPYDHFVPMVEEFCKEIRSGKKTIDYEGELLNQARVVYAGIVSNAQKREVRLEEIT